MTGVRNVLTFTPKGGGGGGGGSFTVDPPELTGFQFTTYYPVTVATFTVGTVVSSYLPPPLSYAWSFDSGSTDIFANTPSSPSTYFSATLSTDTSVSGAWKCTITDGLGGTHVTTPVAITIIATSAPIGPFYA